MLVKKIVLVHNKFEYCGDTYVKQFLCMSLTNYFTCLCYVGWIKTDVPSTLGINNEDFF